MANRVLLVAGKVVHGHFIQVDFNDAPSIYKKSCTKHTRTIAQLWL